MHSQYVLTRSSLSPSDIIDELNIGQRRQADIINQQSKEVISRTHKLSIYHNANSFSWQDPKGYEDTKEFLAKATQTV